MLTLPAYGVSGPRATCTRRRGSPGLTSRGLPSPSFPPSPPPQTGVAAQLSSCHGKASGSEGHPSQASLAPFPCLLTEAEDQQRSRPYEAAR